MIPFKTSTTINNSGLQTVLELDRLDCQVLAFELGVATNALAALEIAIKLAAGGSYQVIASAAGDYSSPVGHVWSATAGIEVLGAGSSGWVRLHDLESVYAVRVRANSAGAASLVTIQGQMGAN